MGVENLAFKDFGGKIFLHIAEKVPDGHRKWDDMLKRAALATQSESKRTVPLTHKVSQTETSPVTPSVWKKS